MLLKNSKFQSTPKLAFEFGLLVGFIILTSYFLSIRYFPIVNLESVIYLPLIVAFFGIPLIGCFVFPFGFAPYLWVDLLKSKGVGEFILNAKGSSLFINAL